jgi:hypothetical protein
MAQAPQVNVGGLNPNAGQQNYAGQMQAWQTNANIAAQGNPWMALAGQVGGAAAGAGMAALV